MSLISDQQMLSGFVNVAGIGLILRIAERTEGLQRHHFGEPDDGVERRAQLVAHRGQERRFRFACGIGLGQRDGAVVQRFLEFGLGRFEVGYMDAQPCASPAARAARW